MNLKARLRGSTQISRQHYRGDRWYVVRDPAGNQYHRLSAPAYRFVGLLDGTRTIAEAWDLVGGQLADDAPTQPEVIQILSQLHAANLLEADITADAGVLLRRHKKMKSRQLQGRLMNILFPRIPLWDPDRFLCKWMPVMKYALSLLGALVWLVVVIGAVAKLSPMWPELKAAANNSIDPSNWPFLWATFVLIKAIHELGHAFSCRRFGGEVHELGVMFLVFVPAPYVDASTAWGLSSKWKRIFVGAGGMIFELFVAAIMAFIWANTTGGAYQLVNQLAYNTMLIASVSTIMFNANPLLRYDGYYILSDLLEIPNLSQKAKEYSLGLIKRHVFRVKSPLPLPPPGQRIWLFVYSIASSIYRVFVGVLIIFIVAGKVPVLGVLMAVGGVITWLFVPIGKLLNYLLLDPELHRKRIGACIFSVAVAAVIVFVVGLCPFTVHYEAVGVVEPDQRQTIHARSPGFVTEVIAHDGQMVAQGQVLVKCVNPEMVAELEGIKAQRRAKILEASAANVNNLSQRDMALKYIRVRFDPVIARKELEISDLEIKAPFAGVLIAPDLPSLQGRYLQVGDDVGVRVVQLDKLQVVAFVEQQDAALPFSDPGASLPQTARIRLAGARGEDLIGRVMIWGSGGVLQLPPDLQALAVQAGGDLQLDPKSANRNSAEMTSAQFPVFLELLKPLPGTYCGQRAYLRFELPRKHPLMWQWWRRLGQLIQTQKSNWL